MPEFLLDYNLMPFHLSLLFIILLGVAKQLPSILSLNPVNSWNAFLHMTFRMLNG